MHICLIGYGLTNLILAKQLLKKKIKVDLYYKKKPYFNKSVRTISISSDNIDYLKSTKLPIFEKGWPVNHIKIFNENNKEKEIFNFDGTQSIKFFVFKNDLVFKQIDKIVSRSKNLKKIQIKSESTYDKIIRNKNYNLIINSEPNNKIIKNFFHNGIVKEYDSIAFTTIIDHKKTKNNTAHQIFTKFGPIAFLPISKNKTSIVFSILKYSKLDNYKEVENLIKKYNRFYEIKFFSKFEFIKLKMFLQRRYVFKNILNFGENIHKIHPLAGQGFNMSLRDIRLLDKFIDEKIKLGLELDRTVISKFEKKHKHLNFLFANGIDFVHEFFKFDNKLNKKLSNSVFNFLKKNKLFNSYVTKVADKGLNI